MVVASDSGDAAQNPGPISLKYPCGICNKAVKWIHDAVQCDDCDHWYHMPCMNMKPEVYKAVDEHSSLRSAVTVVFQASHPHFSALHLSMLQIVSRHWIVV